MQRWRVGLGPCVFWFLWRVSTHTHTHKYRTFKSVHFKYGRASDREFCSRRTNLTTETVYCVHNNWPLIRCGGDGSRFGILFLASKLVERSWILCRVWIYRNLSQIGVRTHNCGWNERKRLYWMSGLLFMCRMIVWINYLRGFKLSKTILLFFRFNQRTKVL